MRPVDLLEPRAEGCEVGDERVDVDPVRRRAVLLEDDQRLREEVDRAAGRAAAGPEMERAGELDERLEERALLLGRRAPGVLPDALGGEVAPEVEEAYASPQRGTGRLDAPTSS